MARDALRPMSDIERLKYEAAEQLGLIDRLLQVGWAGLTAGETGKIGGNRLPPAARRPRLKRFCAMPAMIVCLQQGASCRKPAPFAFIRGFPFKQTEVCSCAFTRLAPAVLRRLKRDFCAERPHLRLQSVLPAGGINEARRAAIFPALCEERNRRQQRFFDTLFRN